MHVELRCLLSLLMSFLPGSVILQCVCADELEFLSLQLFKFPLCSCASKALFFFALVPLVADFRLPPLSFLSLSRACFSLGLLGTLKDEGVILVFKEGDLRSKPEEHDAGDPSSARLVLSRSCSRESRSRSSGRAGTRSCE